MIIKLHPDNFIVTDCPESSLVAELKSLFSYKGAALKPGQVETRLAEIEAMDNEAEFKEGKTKRQYYADRYKYQIVDGEIQSKDGSPFFIDTGEHSAIAFNSNDATINVDGRTLTPDSDISGENAEVQAFFNIIYSHDDCCVAECYRLCKECEAGDVPVTETEEYTEEVIEILDGKAVKTIVTKTREVPVYDEYPLVDENDNPILDDEGNPVVHRVQRVIALPQEKKDRLCLLEDKISALHSA